MSSFVFVPGAWHGAWCFDRLAADLRRAGHHVNASDLPGTALSIAEWAEFVAQIALNCPERPILLGHSRGGIVISAVAELVPNSIQELVYLAGALLPDGAIPLAGLLARMPPGTLAEHLPEFLAPPPFDAVRATAFSECEEGVARSAYAKLAPEPVAPLKSTLSLSEARFGSVPRTYIETLRDRAVLLEDQRAMQAGLPCARVLRIDSDHSPFLSACTDLQEALVGIARRPLR